MSNSKYIVAAPDELYHFKYIKRVQGPDGKWRYYYGDRQTHDRITKNLRKASGLYSSGDKQLIKSTKWAKASRAVGRFAGENKGAIALAKSFNSTAQSRALQGSKDKHRAKQIIDAQDYFTVSSTARRTASSIKKRVRDILKRRKR